MCLLPGALGPADVKVGPVQLSPHALFRAVVLKAIRLLCGTGPARHRARSHTVSFREEEAVCAECPLPPCNSSPCSRFSTEFDFCLGPLPTWTPGHAPGDVTLQYFIYLERLPLPSILNDGCVGYRIPDLQFWPSEYLEY